MTERRTEGRKEWTGGERNTGSGGSDSSLSKDDIKENRGKGHGQKGTEDQRRWKGLTEYCKGTNKEKGETRKGRNRRKGARDERNKQRKGRS